MNGAFYIGAIGLDAQQRALDVVANNIANINTSGFKRSTVRFAELAAALRTADDQVVPQAAALMPSGVSMSDSRVWTQGDMKQTGQALDLAVNGQGFLELLGPAGHALLWRGGSLKVNDDGYLAAPDGTPLRAMIAVPQNAGAITIGSNGVVSTVLQGETQSRQLGQIDLAMVRNPDNLADAGDGYYEAADMADISSVQPGEDGSGTLVQGSLEGANVQLSDEMVSLLLMQRAFAANAQVVQAGDQLMSIANTLRR